MSFDLPHIRKADEYIDTAFYRATKVVAKSAKAREIKKIRLVHDTLVTSLEKILHNFPTLDQLDPFYKELFEIHIDSGKTKKSLAAILWVVQRIKWFGKIHLQKAKRAENAAEPRKAFYGRVNSLLKQIHKELLFLEEARKKVRTFPTIKTGMKTICIVGFPNVGKTTLLSKLTGSTADISNYAFTTKGINIGYKGKIQLLDTPGTLDRENLNIIEKTAELAMKYVADEFIYIFDPTEASAPMEDQWKLYERVKLFKKKVYVYASKSSSKELEKLNLKTLTQLRELLQKLSSQQLSSQPS